MARITLNSVRKFYQSSPAVENLDLVVEDGEFVSLLGPSGCGKSTTLRMIAGFETPDSGRIRFGDQDVTALPPRQRSIGMVFQNYSLFPHLTISENIAYGLRRRREPADAIRKRVGELLDLIRMPGFADRYPASLSGGQQQRVALARAVAAPPKLLLMDEPLGALDLKLREAMQVEIRLLHRKFNLTTIYVTHDQSEAFAMSDRIAVMQRGRIEQIASGPDIYRRPATEFVARFVGRINLLPARLVGTSGDHAIAETPVGTTRLAKPVPALRELLIGIRPEDVTLNPEAASDGAEIFGPFQAVVRDIVFGGGRTRIDVEAAGGTCLELEIAAGRHCPAIGETVSCGWKQTDMMALAPDQSSTQASAFEA